MSATYSEQHPHEPEIPPALDPEGRCRVCGLLVERAELAQQLEQAERDKARAVFIAKHLFQMVPKEAWRAQGADDMQGHYEGDYWAEQTREELAALTPDEGADPAVEAELPPCDCRANDWVEGDNGAVRCVQCGGYAGEPGTSIRIAPVDEGADPGGR